MSTNERKKPSHYHKYHIHTNPPKKKKIHDVLEGTKRNLDLNLTILRKLKGHLGGSVS